MWRTSFTIVRHLKSQIINRLINWIVISHILLFPFLSKTNNNHSLLCGTYCIWIHEAIICFHNPTTNSPSVKRKRYINTLWSGNQHHWQLLLLWYPAFSDVSVASQPVFISHHHMGEAAHPSDEHMSHADMGITATRPENPARLWQRQTDRGREQPVFTPSLNLPRHFSHLWWTHEVFHSF